MSLKPSTSNPHLVQAAIESRNWKALPRILSSVPSQLPKFSDPAVITASLEQVSGVADAIIQACDFRTSFESSFTTRKALTDIPSVLSWATESLKGFSFDERVVGRIATMLGLLGMGANGRAAVGCAGAVDQLTILWSAHLANVEIVKALVSLCSGHIDNVSRTMRRRGISLAVDVLSDENNKQDVSLIEQTLVYVGLCVICTPDTTREEHIVVPALLAILEDDLNLRRPQLLRHVLMALGNIVDCWTKEGFGYHLGNETRLVDAVLKAWASLRRSKDIATASSWALGSILLGEGTQRKALQCRLEEVKVLAELWKTEFKTCAFLYETADLETRKQNSQLNHDGDPMMTVATSVDGSSSNTVDTSEDNINDTNPSMTKRKRRRGSPNRERLAEQIAEKQTEQSSPVRHCDFGNRCTADRSPTSVRNVCGSHASSIPHSDPCTGNHQSKKAQKKPRSTSAKRSVKETPIRKSKRQRKPSGRSRHAKPIPIEIIEISSDSDDDHRSPKAVQDMCT